MYPPISAVSRSASADVVMVRAAAGAAAPCVLEQPVNSGVVSYPVHCQSTPSIQSAEFAKPRVPLATVVIVTAVVGTAGAAIAALVDTVDAVQPTGSPAPPVAVIDVLAGMETARPVHPVKVFAVFPVQVSVCGTPVLTVMVAGILNAAGIAPVLIVVTVLPATVATEAGPRESAMGGVLTPTTYPAGGNWPGNQLSNSLAGAPAVIVGSPVRSVVRSESRMRRLACE